MIRPVLAAAAIRLREAGVPSPEHDAAVLLAHVLGVERSRLPLVDDVPAEALERYDGLVARRVAREPLQHLTGLAWFRHVELAVGPGVFVPRPETELLAGWAVEAARGLDTPVVVDLCTGSGAIAKAIADEVRHARLHAVELDEPAHHWAEQNLAGTDVDLRQGDFATAFDDLAGTVDVVVCNPPYVPLEAWESVAARFCSAQRWAGSSSSTACTRACGTSWASDLAIAPEPVHRSTTTGSSASRARSTAQPATSSVSGRGTKTPGPTYSCTWRKPVEPVRCCNGSRATLRASSASKLASCSSVTSRTRLRPPREVPTACARSALAS